MKRYHIVEGNLTTVGGIVTSATSTYIIEGKRVPLEGDYVSCRACKSVGYIVCTGPRIEQRENGKLLVLEGDLCSCKCVPPPKLIPSQSLSFHTVEQESAPFQGYAPEGKAAHDDGTYDQFFHLLDEVTGKPLANRHYRMTFNGKTIEGITDEQGRTRKVEADHAADVQIEIFPEGYVG